MTVEDKIEVNIPVKEAFIFFINNISKWWSKNDEIEKKENGKIILYWDSGSKLESSFNVFKENKEIEFRFGPENLNVQFESSENRAKISIIHSDIGEVSTVIHVAQSWRFLLLNFKMVIEKNIDLRNE